MTRVQAVGVLLIGLGLIYAVMYAGWLRRRRKHASAAVAPEPVAAPPSARNLARVEGTYISTTMDTSRLDRVAAAGLGVRAKATMVVDDRFVRWEREGADDVRVSGTRLLRVSRERGLPGKLIGQTRIVLVSWHADNGDRYATGFLPRRRADSAALVEAVQRLAQTKEEAPGGTP